LYICSACIRYFPLLIAVGEIVCSINMLSASLIVVAIEPIAATIA
jgi:hypothetical protein